MNKEDILRLAYNSLMRRKARTILTVLGVIIGTAAIIVMLSLGIGLNENQRRNMERWGSLNVIRIYSGMRWDEEGNPIGEAKALTDEAVAEIKALEGITAVSPAIDVWGEIKWGRKQGGFPIIGLEPAELEALEFSVEAGRLLEPGDRQMLIVGSQVINSFWDPREMQKGGMVVMGPGGQTQQDATELLNQRISLTVTSMGDPPRRRTFNFQVVGVLDESNMERAWEAYGPIEEIKRIRSFMNQGARTTQMMMMEKTMPGGSRSSSRSPRPEETYSYILARAQDVGYAKKLSSTLREMGYNAWSMADNLEGIERVARVMQAILGGIGSISLLVAALGITNTMIMSIYERTREIGIMKVIGASFQDVRLLFLAEAGLIGLGGGSLGLVLSYLVSYLLNRFGAGFINQGMEGGEAVISIIPPWLALFAVAFAVVVGLVAGLYPASRAMRLSPVDAIRNE